MDVPSDPSFDIPGYPLPNRNNPYYPPQGGPPLPPNMQYYYILPKINGAYNLKLNP